MSEQLFDDYFTVETSRNIKGLKFQCPEVRQKKLKETESRKSIPDRGLQGQVTMKSSLCMDCVIKASQYSWTTCPFKKLNSICLWKKVRVQD